MTKFDPGMTTCQFPASVQWDRVNSQPHTLLEKTKMKLKQHKVLTFDVVGTLIDFEQGVVNYIRPVAEKAGRGDLTDEQILLSFAAAETALHAKTPGVTFTTMLPHIYRIMASEFGLSQADADVEGLRMSISDWPAFPDSIDALKQLRKHFRLIAASNADNWSVREMAKTLQEPFDDIVTAEDVENCKPNPQFFSYLRGTQRVHGYHLEDYMHVAQSQFHDIGVAKQLGYAVCWIERRHDQKGFGGSPTPKEGVTQPDYHFRTLGEFAQAVEAER